MRTRQWRFEGFDEKILALYGRGSSTRDIERYQRELYGVSVGRDLITRAPHCPDAGRRPWTRIQNQDVRIIGQASAARSAVAVRATRLGALNARQQTVTTQALYARNSLYRATAALLQRRIAVAQARAADAGQHVTAQAQIAGRERQLSKLEAAQASGESPGQAGGTGHESSSGGSSR